MKVSDYVIRFLEEKAVDTMFFLPGGGCMHLLDSMGSSRKINSISLLHEQAVAVACEAYANTTGKMGIAMVTTGPGATNTITGMLAAYLDSVPCLFITGQVKTTDLKSRFGVRSNGSQEADIVTIASSITKYAVMITEKEKIRYHLERAWFEALDSRRGPVLVDIPLDIQGAQIEPEKLEGFTFCGSKTEIVDVSEIINLLNKAHRPVLIAGNGLSTCKKDFYALIETFSIPVIPSWKAIDYISNDSPLYAGRAGGMGDRSGNLTMQNADLILSLGCRLDFSITGFDRNRWAPGAKKIIVEIDPAEIKKLENAGDLCPIVADVGVVIRNLLIRQKEIHINDLSEWKKRIAQWRQKYPVVTLNKYTNSHGELTSYGFIDELCCHLSSGAFIAPCSSGTTAEIFFQSFIVKKGQTIRSNHGLGSMGFEIPNAIGMCVASGLQEVMCIAGDGGMQLNIQELAVISGRKLPIKIFVINNRGYASIRNMQNNHFQGRYAGCDDKSGLFLPNLEKLSLAYGIPYFCIRQENELENAIKTVLNTNGPLICEIFVEQECMVTPRSASLVLEDGTICSSPLENQFPFLSEVETAENMGVLK